MNETNDTLLLQEKILQKKIQDKNDQDGLYLS